MANGNTYPKSHHSNDEEDDFDTTSAGLREVGVSKKKAMQKALAQVKRPASHGSNNDHLDSDMSLEQGNNPLRPAKVALKQALDMALDKHSSALGWIDQKVARATRSGQFSFKFTFGEVEGLNVASHSEYVAFIQLLDIHGYSAKYINSKTEDIHKELFVPSTTIIIDFLPKKK
jgi:hypothetical protein